MQTYHQLPYPAPYACPRSVSCRHPWLNGAASVIVASTMVPWEIVRPGRQVDVYRCKESLTDMVLFLKMTELQDRRLMEAQSVIQGATLSISAKAIVCDKGLTVGLEEAGGPCDLA